MEVGHVAHCLSVLAGLISVTVADDLRVISPAGPKMCERLCQQTVGCSSYRFSSAHLSCHLQKGISPEDRSDGIFTVKKNKDIYKLESSNCPSSALVFLNKKKYFICRTKNSIYHEGPNHTLLLMTESGLTRQLSIGDNTVSPYPHTLRLSCSEVAYVPSSKKLVIRKDTDLILAPVSLESYENINTNICGGFGVAEDRVFFFHKASGKVSLCSMSPYGKDWKSLTPMTGRRFYIAVNTKRKQIYVCNSGYVILSNYDGKLVRVLKKRYDMVIIPPHSDWAFALYYNQHKVVRLSLDHDTEQFYFSAMTIDWEKESFCIYDNILFVINEKCEVMIITKSGKQSVKIFEKGGRCVCCIIPLTEE